MLTRRGRLLLVLGGALYVAAWAFGSQPLYPVAIGFLLAVLVSAVSVHAAARPMGYRRRSDSIEHVEGDDVVVDVELEPREPTRACVGDRRRAVRAGSASIGSR